MCDCCTYSPRSILADCIWNTALAAALAIGLTHTVAEAVALAVQQAIANVKTGAAIDVYAHAIASAVTVTLARYDVSTLVNVSTVTTFSSTFIQNVAIATGN